MPAAWARECRSGFSPQSAAPPQAAGSQDVASERHAAARHSVRLAPRNEVMSKRRGRSLLSVVPRGARPRLATPYSIAAIVSRAKRARTVICRFRASVLAELAPCLRAFLLPLGAPPAAPCIRQANGGRAALEPAPLRFGVASRRQVYRQGHGVVLQLFCSPLPPGHGH
jgi:hypothetical protein